MKNQFGKLLWSKSTMTEIETTQGFEGGSVTLKIPYVLLNNVSYEYEESIKKRLEGAVWECVFKYTKIPKLEMYFISEMYSLGLLDRKEELEYILTVKIVLPTKTSFDMLCGYMIKKMGKVKSESVEETPENPPTVHMDFSLRKVPQTCYYS